MSVATRPPGSVSGPAAGAFPLVIGSHRVDPAVEGNHWPVVPMSVRLCGRLWGVTAACPLDGAELRVLMGLKKSPVWLRQDRRTPGRRDFQPGMQTLSRYA
jgi:hypothetical protein